jgi:hypothetical protein
MKIIKLVKKLIGPRRPELWGAVYAYGAWWNPRWWDAHNIMKQYPSVANKIYPAPYGHRS